MKTNADRGVWSVVWLMLLAVYAASWIDPACAQQQTETREWSTALHDYLMAEANRLFDQRQEQVQASLKSPGALRARQDRLRRDYERILGYLPERTPLSSIRTGIAQQEGYRVEMIAFESRPDHHVTANLYVPDGLKEPRPGILIPCGHSANGKASDAYQSAAILLAKQGFVVLVVDPICQGERWQVAASDGPVRPGGGTVGHTALDAGAKLVGASVTGYELWDNVRGIDYLQSRPEVDPARIGVTGNSGGGTQTTYLMAYDDRVAVAAPSCYVMTRRKLFETIGPQDGCQNLFGEVALGIDHADYITMRAPKPTIILAAEQDFFDFEGVKAAYAEAQKTYQVLGEPERVDLFSFDDTHGFSQPRRQRAAEWMRGWFNNETVDVVESEPSLLPEQQLWVTASGQVRRQWPEERTVADLNLERARELAPQRDAFLKNSKEDIRAEIARLLGLAESSGSPQVTRGDEEQVSGFTCRRFEIRGVDGIPLPALLIRPGQGGDRIALLADGRGKEAEIRQGGLAASLLEEGYAVVAVDLRGFGETQDDPGHTQNRYAGGLNREYRNAVLAMHLARPLVGQRVQDIRTVLDALPELVGRKPESVTLVGIELAGPPALHAAVLDDRIGRLVLRETLVSWMDLLENPTMREQYSWIVPFAMTRYDLSDLIDLAGRDRVAVEKPLFADR